VTELSDADAAGNTLTAMVCRRRGRGDAALPRLPDRVLVTGGGRTTLC